VFLRPVQRLIRQGPTARQITSRRTQPTSFCNFRRSPLRSRQHGQPAEWIVPSTIFCGGFSRRRAAAVCLHKVLASLCCRRTVIDAIQRRPVEDYSGPLLHTENEWGTLRPDNGSQLLTLRAMVEEVSPAKFAPKIAPSILTPDPGDKPFPAQSNHHQKNAYPNHPRSANECKDPPRSVHTQVFKAHRFVKVLHGKPQGSQETPVL